MVPRGMIVQVSGHMQLDDVSTARYEGRRSEVDQNDTIIHV
jgi:hypothetical protein